MLRIRTDQARLKIRLRRGVFPITKTAVRIDIADRELRLIEHALHVAHERSINRLRIRVRRISENFHASKSRRGDGAQRFLEREASESICGKSELCHGFKSPPMAMGGLWIG